MIDTLPQLKVLRGVKDLTPGAYAYLLDEYERRRISIDPLTDRPRADVIHPSTGFVDNDLPRDEAITLEIMEKTTGFAVAGYLGQIIQKFKKFEDAERARANATVRLDVQVDGLEEDETEDEETNGALAGPARRSRALEPGH